MFYIVLAAPSHYLYLGPKKKNVCAYGHLTNPIFQPTILTFFIGNYSTINFYIEFG